MKVVEQSVIGKASDPARCEDVVVITNSLIAVIDGATDKSGVPVRSEYGETSSGRFAALVVAAALEQSTPGQDPTLTVAQISAALNDAIRLCIGQVDDHARPTASVVVFDTELRAVWRVGDCPFRIDSELHSKPKRIDEVISTFRAAFLAASPEPQGPTDVGREAILPLLRIQGALANKPGEFGYGVIDGREVPREFVEVFSVASGATEIVLASDGYPTLPATLSDAETELVALLLSDPLCTGPLRGTKGLIPGQRSFDDRAWVRVVL